MKPFERQTTLADTVRLDGIGVHRGKAASVTIAPAPVDTGILFSSTNGAELIARYDMVRSTALSTVIGDASGTIATIEHLMAALCGLGIDNAYVEVDGDEVPILDGSSAPFVAAFESVGLKRQRAGRRVIRVLKPVRVSQGDAVAELAPCDHQAFDVTIDFDTPAIGRQALAFALTPDFFRAELARARTFGFLRDVEGLWSKGFALGASYDNAVVIGDDEVLNRDGLRYADEFVRHKALDAVGDLSLAGAPIMGRYRSVCGGHRLNVAMLDALFADPGAYEIVDLPRFSEAKAGHAEPAAMPVAAFAPDLS